MALSFLKLQRTPRFTEECENRTRIGRMSSLVGLDPLGKPCGQLQIGGNPNLLPLRALVALRDNPLTNSPCSSLLSVVQTLVDPNIKKNAAAWDELARRQAKLAQPAKDEDFQNPLQTVDPLGWLGGEITGKAVLCLAAGGGRQSALYAAAGARVTVVDLSGEMLSLDRAVATERGLEVRTVETSMERLEMFQPGEFDCVIQPVSTCYVPDVGPVFAAVTRVLRPSGIYVSQHKSPVSLQAGLKPIGNAYGILEPYYRDQDGKNEPLPTPTQPSRLREPGTVEYLHRWEQVLGGMCRAGFVIEDLIEPVHADPEAAVGTFGHRGQFIAPYFRVKARRQGSEERRSKQLIT